MDEPSARLPLVPAVAVRGARGAVTSPHALASQAGLALLRAGGTATDAAIAANAALAVVASYACGLGGDAFWLIWTGERPDEGPGGTGEGPDVAQGPEPARLRALNGSGRAASSATIGAMRAAGLGAMPRLGPWTVTVPGAVRSWADAHASHGRRPWADLLAPAIELADGFPASATWANAIERAATTYGERSDWARVFRPRGRPWRVGERVTIPTLAATLRRLAADGPDDLYAGALATRTAAYLGEAGSPLTAADLAEHASTWEDPIRTTYRGVEATSHPPNSCGVVALELLAILDALPPPDPAAFGPTGVTDGRWVHLALEAARLTLADRDAWLTDPEWMEDGALVRFLDRSRARALADRLGPDRAAPPDRTSGPAGGDTVYLAATDRWGGAVSLIESNYAGFGSGLVDPETGIAFQNRGTFFSLDPRHPNCLAPRKRTMHTLTPGMLFRDGRPWIVHGSMGGEIQPQVFAQFVSAMVDGGVPIATAVAAPRWVADVEGPGRRDPVARLERGMDPRVAASLEARGYVVAWGGPGDPGFGHEHAIAFVRDDAAPRTLAGPSASNTETPATYEATADPRSEGLPAAF